MSNHPVQLRVEPEQEMERIQLAIRFLLLCALGTVGASSIYWLLFLGIPAVAALRISSLGGERYLKEDGPKILPVLRWLATAYAYLWLLTDEPPTSEDFGVVELEVEPSGSPTTGAALLRLLYSLPALLLLAILSMVAGILWVVGALGILFVRRVPHAIADFLEMTLRYQFRLVAYHLSLVDSYPTTEKSAPPLPQMPLSV